MRNLQKITSYDYDFSRKVAINLYRELEMRYVIFNMMQCVITAYFLNVILCNSHFGIHNLLRAIDTIREIHQIFTCNTIKPPCFEVM